MGCDPSVLAQSRQDEAQEDFGASKRLLFAEPNRGRFLARCPAGRAAVRCCGYLVLNLASNCPMDCHYCFLQDYLAGARAVTVRSNIRDALEEVEAFLDRHPRRPFRIGTGEFADSLALDALTGLSRELVPFFAAQDRALLELKTKTVEIGNLLRMDGRGRVVVSWSLAPARVIAELEYGTAPLADRLAAARKCQEHGYKVGFHFDPLIDYPDWPGGYEDVVARLAEAVDRGSVAWISMGSLRLTRKLRATIRSRFPRSPILAGEYVESPDGKLRLFRPARVVMYRLIGGWLRKAFPDTPLYLCMEPPQVWERALGTPAPREADLADTLAAR